MPQIKHPTLPSLCQCFRGVDLLSQVTRLQFINLNILIKTYKHQFTKQYALVLFAFFMRNLNDNNLTN